MRIKFAQFNPTYISCVREHHADGSLHLHAVVCLEKKCDIRDGVATLGFPKELGVNIQNCKSVDASLKYIEKEGVPDTYGLRPAEKPLAASTRAEIAI